MLNLNFVHREVTRISGSEYGTCCIRRRSDQAVRLGQGGTEGRELPPPLTSLPAVSPTDRLDTETIKEPVHRLGFRRTQPPDDLLDIDGRGV